MRATIWVDPAHVVHDVANIRTRKPKNVGGILDKLGVINKNTKNCNLFYRNRFIISKEDFVIRENIEKSEKFKLVQDFVDSQGNFANSIWYQKIVTELREHGSSKYKKITFRTENEIDDFFENYLTPICTSMMATGYDQNLASDVCKCYVSGDGELMKGENGRHRLAFAKALGVQRFPLTVFGVHEDWFSKRIGNKMDFAKLAEELKKLEIQFS